MKDWTYRNHEYDDYPVPEKIVPLTDENMEEYRKICDDIDKVVEESLKALGIVERPAENGVSFNKSEG